MKGKGPMPATLRLTAAEQELLRKKCTEINKLLIRHGREPLKDSELAHFGLEKSMAYIEVGPDGTLRFSVQ